MKSTIMRVSLMVEGVHCAVIFNGHSKNYMTHSDKNGDLYLNIGCKRYYEKDLPMGEEVLA